MEKRSCKHCHQFFTPVRNPEQHVCRRRLCQNARKATWRREKYRQDADYRENRHHAYQIWRENNPEYWKDYRATHPSYTDRNREQQMERNKRLRGSTRNASLIAKCDALTEKNTVKAGRYQLIPLSGAVIAKCDALLVEISLLTDTSQQTGDDCKNPPYRH